MADGYGNRRVAVFDSETGAYKRHSGEDQSSVFGEQLSQKVNKHGDFGLLGHYAIAAAKQRGIQIHRRRDQTGHWVLAIPLRLGKSK